MKNNKYDIYDKYSIENMANRWLERLFKFY